jgi:hypothetical protein
MTNPQDTTPAAPSPPGWPDPLESPQAEAIRNGKLDDTEIRNLFDCMERELRLHRERAANPAQVTDAMVEAAQKVLERRIYDEGGVIGEEVSNMVRQMLTAAIGAVPKNDASASIAEMRQTAKELRENANGDCNAARQAIYWDGKADALEAAIGAGGQAVTWQRYNERSDSWSQVDPDYAQTLAAGGETVRPLFTHPAPSWQAGMEDWQRIDDALVSCAGLLRTLCKDEIGDTAATELEYVRSAISNPPAQPGWRMAPITPTQEMMDAADRARPLPESYVYEIYGAMLSAAPLPGGA